ncbi:MAG TPA: hypothetical protein VMW76_08675 [Bacteroidales bacterium]|nr:hypothetical protein [Bacteroidales bacterium]
MIHKSIKLEQISFLAILVIIGASMPCAANIVILARMFRVDDQLAVSNVFLPTLFSIISLPFIYFIMEHFLL